MPPFTREIGLFMTTPHPAFTAGISFANPTPASVSTPTAVNSETHLVVHFGDEEVIFNKADIPIEPPAVHFANNIDGLLREWHDSRRLVI